MAGAIVRLEVPFTFVWEGESFQSAVCVPVVKSDAA
jgi:hypothetical protein